MSTVTISTLKAQDNAFNAFLADDDKYGDLVVATTIIDGGEISAMAETEEAAIEELRDEIAEIFRAKNHKAQLEINKAIGLYFFE